MVRLWLEADERVPSAWRMKQMRVSKKNKIHMHVVQEEPGKEGDRGVHWRIDRSELIWPSKERTECGLLP